ncbi:MAG: helix-turn-helix transcriptional regulator [Pseudomonadota bacterium]
MDFGKTLCRFRTARRLSQLALAEQSGVSQRHISFLESGRSRPGIDSVAKLSAALDLSYAETNLLYASAGLACPRPAFAFDDLAFAPARQAIDQLLQSHAPNPAAATLRNGEIVRTNRAFDAALHWAFEDVRPWRHKATRPENLYALTLHPDGLRRFMVNPEDIIPHTLRRLRAAAGADVSARRMLEEAEAYDGISELARRSEPEGSALSSVLVERYLVRGRSLNLVSMVASFGSPEDATAQSLNIELFCPDDPETKTTLNELISIAAA